MTNNPVQNQTARNKRAKKEAAVIERSIAQAHVITVRKFDECAYEYYAPSYYGNTLFKHWRKRHAKQLATFREEPVGSVLRLPALKALIYTEHTAKGKEVTMVAHCTTMQDARELAADICGDSAVYSKGGFPLGYSYDFVPLAAVQRYYASSEVNRRFSTQATDEFAHEVALGLHSLLMDIPDYQTLEKPVTQETVESVIRDDKNIFKRFIPESVYELYVQGCNIEAAIGILFDQLIYYIDKRLVMGK